AEVREMKSLVARGALGKVLSAEANYSHSGGLSLTSQQWRWDENKCPALPLMQLGIHHIDNLVYLLGSVRRVFSTASTIDLVQPPRPTKPTFTGFLIFCPYYFFTILTSSFGQTSKTTSR
ncbi:unnamed protein product, partial [marine sediment metagenome]